MKGKSTFWRAIGGAAVIVLFGLAAMACDTGGGSAAIAGGGGSGGTSGGGTSIYGAWEGSMHGVVGIMTLTIRPNNTWTLVVPGMGFPYEGTFVMVNATTARLYQHFFGLGHLNIGSANINPAGTAITVTMSDDPFLAGPEFAGMVFTLTRVGGAGTQQITITQIPAQYQGMHMSIQLLTTPPGSISTVANASLSSPSHSAAFGLYFGGQPVVAHGEFDIRLTISLGGGHQVRYRIPARNIAAGSSAIPFSAFGSPVPSISVTVNGIPQQYQDSGARISLHIPGNEVQRAASSVWVSGSSATLNMVNWINPLAVPANYDIRLEFAEDWIWGTGPIYRIASRNLAAGGNAIHFLDFSLAQWTYVTVTGIPNHYHDNWGDLDLHIPSNAARIARAEVRVTGPEATFRFLGVEQRTYDVFLWLNDFGVRYALPSRNIYNGVSIPFSAFAPAPQSLSAETGSAELTSPAPRERR